MEARTTDEAKRFALHEMLSRAAGTDHIYFQPPENVTMRYPAVVYHLRDISKQHADNRIYGYRRRYTITYITRDPDDPAVGRIGALPYCAFDRAYVAENLNHYSYTIDI